MNPGRFTGQHELLFRGRRHSLDVCGNTKREYQCYLLIPGLGIFDACRFRFRIKSQTCIIALLHRRHVSHLGIHGFDARSCLPLWQPPINI